MKIYFNRKPVLGPWGGGSKVLLSIINECVRRNHQVFVEENINDRDDFDLIFCMDPKPTSNLDFNMLLRKKARNNKTHLIQRVGDLGTHGKPELFELVKASSSFADALIFPSNWAKQYLNPPAGKSCHVIQNAPLKEFLIRKEKKILTNKIKIVSHHWSDNPYKGFEIYEKLDEYCEPNDFSFTFIGRKPDKVKLKNYYPPKDAAGLIQEIPKHDVYVTASKFEAGANHVLEAMAMGLPVLYHKDGGSINEYCQDFGIQYDSFDELIDILVNRKDEIQKISDRISYTRSSELMASEYVNFFESLS